MKPPCLSIDYLSFLFLWKILSNKAGITGSGVTLELTVEAPGEAAPAQVLVEAAETSVSGLHGPCVLPTPTPWSPDVFPPPRLLI